MPRVLILSVCVLAHRQQSVTSLEHCGIKTPKLRVRYSLALSATTLERGGNERCTDERDLAARPPAL